MLRGISSDVRLLGLGGSRCGAGRLVRRLRLLQLLLLLARLLCAGRGSRQLLRLLLACLPLAGLL